MFTLLLLLAVDDFSEGLFKSFAAKLILYNCSWYYLDDIFSCAEFADLIKYCISPKKNHFYFLSEAAEKASVGKLLVINLKYL